MRIKQSLFLALLFVLCSGPVGVSKAQSSNQGTGVGVGPGVQSDYIISPDDVLDIYLVDVPEMSRQYRVSPLGTVTLPLMARPIPAAGRTLGDFADHLKSELSGSGLVSRPQLTVSVHQSRLASVAITGAVKRPQIYPVFGRTTILDVLSQAEGLADDAGNTAIIRRGDTAVLALGLEKDANGRAVEASRTVTVDLKKLLESGAEESNVEVYPGDRVTVPRAGIVYVVGAVNRPGGFPMKPTSGGGVTVLQALAMAEDFKSTAIKDKAVLIRTDASAPGGRTQTPVKLSQVLAGKAPDPAMQADDILFVPDSSSKKILRRGAEAIIQAATGVMIYRR